MNIEEMKAEIIDMITQIDDEETLVRLYEAIQDIVDETEDDSDEDESDGWSNLTPEQQKKLEFAIAKTYDPTQMVS